ncbi:MAG: response regulator [Sulfurovum sp.]|nr:response regulator [Sulfurovum sp.]
MGMTLMWVILAAVLLYVLKTLYDVNIRHIYDEEPEESVDPGRRKVRVLPKLDIEQPHELPPGVSPEESLRQAENYKMEVPEEFQSEADTTDAAPLLVVKELIPETEHIDLDCFSYFKGAKVLVVEDNPLNQKIIKTVLKQSGIELDIAGNGQEALDLLFKEKREYDLILMDISMPVMDGITTTKIIRRASRFNRLPIVTFTAFSLGPEIEAMFKAGANAYLTKPLNVAQLYTVLMLFIGNVNRGLSPEKMLEIQGLDTKKGLENADGDERLYAERLRHFIHRYSPSIEQIPLWITDERYDRLRLECKEMLPLLSQIGAFDMYEMVQEMQLQFVYRNEHLLEKFKLLYRATMQALIDTINVYLETLEKHEEKAARD